MYTPPTEHHVRTRSLRTFYLVWEYENVERWKNHFACDVEIIIKTFSRYDLCVSFVLWVIDIRNNWILNQSPTLALMARELWIANVTSCNLHRVTLIEEKLPRMKYPIWKNWQNFLLESQPTFSTINNSNRNFVEWFSQISSNSSNWCQYFKCVSLLLLFRCDFLRERFLLVLQVYVEWKKETKLRIRLRRYNKVDNFISKMKSLYDYRFIWEPWFYHDETYSIEVGNKMRNYHKSFVHVRRGVFFLPSRVVYKKNVPLKTHPRENTATILYLTRYSQICDVFYQHGIVLN